MKRLTAVVLVLWAFGCSPAKKEESMTSGQLTVLVTESYVPLIRKEAQEFQDFYPETSVEIVGVPTREAIVQMINDSVRCIVVDRPLNSEEQLVISQSKLRIVDTKIADDALVAIVNKQNKLASISLAEIEAILRGEMSWSNFPDSKLSGSLYLALTGRNSGVYELLATHFFRSSSNPNISYLAQSQLNIVEFVSNTSGGIGFVSYSFLKDTTDPILVALKQSIHPLSIEVKDSLGVPVSVHADQYTIYHGTYPLTHPLYMYTFTKKVGVAEGFSSFVAGHFGQKIIQYADLVPERIPYRVVQLTEE